MCGIVGYTGNQEAAPILLDGLSKLEYRGYDSAGLAVRNGTQLAEVVKATGKLRNLAEKTDNGHSLPGTCGIGHTRWATHGEPNEINAHPHVSGNARGSASGPVPPPVCPTPPLGPLSFPISHCPLPLIWGLQTPISGNAPFPKTWELSSQMRWCHSWWRHAW